MVISYRDSAVGVTPEQLGGFFQGWPNQPGPSKHLAILQGSDHVVLAFDGARVVGFISATSDGVLSAHVPLLEVLSEYQGRGIGSELVRQMLEKLSGLYIVDLVCDPELQGFYARFGMKPYTAMIIRNLGSLG
jgi:ribosomal protein S18 acetylase RimI-like enzyme